MIVSHSLIWYDMWHSLNLSVELIEIVVPSGFKSRLKKCGKLGRNRGLERVLGIPRGSPLFGKTLGTRLGVMLMGIVNVS